ncbi:hypothetical protein [Nocardia sp. NPDC051570]|uniref:hypothetical protein n=1 Tax=Nocardia sp. NPDC051570 TaxID=3364324 RepID=UPI00379374CD
MSAADDFRVLAVLAPGGTLTVDQLARAADLTTKKARDAVAALHLKGLVTSNTSARWSITDIGQRAWTSKGQRNVP